LKIEKSFFQELIWRLPAASWVLDYSM